MAEGKKEFPAYSALFNLMQDSMFVRDNLSYKIISLYKDIGSNLEIYDENRLREILFDKIEELYNERIRHYRLKKDFLTDEDKETLEISKFLLTNDVDGYFSGLYKIYPRAFYCKKCGNFHVFYSDEFKNIDMQQCSNPECNGKYIQFPFVGFCETCGKITDQFNICEKHGDKFLKLIQYDVTSPITWKLRCAKCGTEKDFLTTCYHNHYGEKISKEKPSKFRPINVQQGSVSRPVVETMVDIPRELHLNDIRYLDYISLGLYLGQFDAIKEDLPDIFAGLPHILSQMDIRKYDFENDKKYFDSFDDGLMKSYDVFFSELKDLSFQSKQTAHEVNDYLILTGFYHTLFNLDSVIDVVKLEDLEGYDNTLKESHEVLKEDLGIADIYYLSDIHLISSAIGSNKGMVKIGPEAVPHFEPYRNSKTNNLKILSYPFETEAILIDLDKIKLVNWLIDNKFLKRDYPETKEQASIILLNLLKDDEEDAYVELHKLIHTFSHILIKRSSVYTGLQEDSCSEMLLASLGAFLIYSTSNVKIGGFSYVLENNLKEWFGDVKLDVGDCVFDPVCIDDEGACFSCLYLADHACCNFNKNLDRDIFLGSIRYKGFWD